MLFCELLSLASFSTKICSLNIPFIVLVPKAVQLIEIRPTKGKKRNDTQSDLSMTQIKHEFLI